MRREIETVIQHDLQTKLVLLSGPRQVGKTTLSRQLVDSSVYLNYDVAADRHLLLKQEWDREAPLLVLDELHKMRRWKNWLKGVWDGRDARQSVLVTGSARMDVYRKGGDSLAGRYFSHRLHPFTVAELRPHMEPEETLRRLLRFGGFPEPFLQADDTFVRRWRRSHVDSILREDVLDLEKVRDLKSMEVLLDLLRTRVGSPVALSPLANELQVSPHTVKHWLQILEDLYVLFPVRPYTRNIARGLLKEAKYYFYDSGAVAEVGASPGAVLENVVAGALLRELHKIEDQTGRRGALHYIRDKEKREVDFVTVVENDPKHLIEVKWSDDAFSPALARFAEVLPSAVAVQVVGSLDRIKSTPRLRMVSAAAFLASLAIETETPGPVVQML